MHVTHFYSLCILNRGSLCSHPPVLLTCSQLYTPHVVKYTHHTTHRYAIVTRPVRQSRLKLALEEVMSSQSEQAQLSAHQQPSNQPPTQTSGTSEYGQVAHLMQSMQSAAEQGLSDPQQASLQASGTPPQELLPENGVQGGGRRSDPMAGQLQQEDRGLDSKLSTQSMPSMQNGSLYGAHAEHDVCQHRRNGLQRAPKVCCSTVLMLHAHALTLTQDYRL